jgi:tungstate transport system permease protein
VDLIWAGIKDAYALISAGNTAVMEATLMTLQVSISAVLAATLIALPLGAFSGYKNFPGRNFLVVIARTGMGIPTVFVGLVCFAMFSRHGPMGGFDLLYSPQAIAAGEFLLALPIIFAMSHGAISSLDPRAGETAKALGAKPIRLLATLVSEARIGVILGILTALARCLTELGIAVMVGGNIAGRTRTLSTATALETGRGEFARGIAMGLILLTLSLSFTLLLALLTREKHDRAQT